MLLLLLLLLLPLPAAWLLLPAALGLLLLAADAAGAEHAVLLVHVAVAAAAATRKGLSVIEQPDSSTNVPTGTGLAACQLQYCCCNPSHPSRLRLVLRMSLLHLPAAADVDVAAFLQR
jgi:hypothetical protein